MGSRPTGCWACPRATLLANGRRQQPLRGTEQEIDFPPVVKLFNPSGAATWLLTELDPEDPDIAFGLCDLGTGFPELGSVSLRELASVRGPLGQASSHKRCYRTRRRRGMGEQSNRGRHDRSGRNAELARREVENTRYRHDHRAIWRVDQIAPAGRYRMDDAERIAEMKNRRFTEAREQLPELRRHFFEGEAEPFVPFHSL